ncbi:hypothetical protein MMC16_000113 [Acarospora aff. strigata]|nr:hypothetical protein [Acarospora aff. strigata]
MALAPQNNSGGFSQQGQLDWVALAKAPVTFTFEALARYSKAGVDSLTVVGGQAICSSFNLPPNVQHNVLDILEKLPRLSLYGKVAWFGFGLHHVLQDLTERDGGVACLALCSCLTESYDSFFGAQVLRALCKKRLPNIPSELLPGLRPWEALLKPCAGVFSNTKFPKLVDGFSRILGFEFGNGVDERTPTEPGSLAQALLQLAQISGKQYESCAFSGGIDCAWLAAFAEYAFEFSVDIKDHDDAYLYRSGSGHRNLGGEAQVTVMKGAKSSQSIEIAHKCFILPTGLDLLHQSARKGEHFFRFQNRSPWTRILSDTFGSSAECLLNGSNGQHFARLLVSLAYQTSTYIEHDGSSITMRHCPRSPHGNDMLNFARWRLPELEPCLGGIELQTGSRYPKGQVNTSIEALEIACGCKQCGPATGYSPRVKCLVWLARTIISYIRILSMVEVQDLLPTPFGLNELYSENLLGGRSQEWHLEAAFRLFSPPSRGPYPLWLNSPLALAANGICCWYGILTDVESLPVFAAKVYITPGHIEHDGSIFDMIENLFWRNRPRFMVEPKRNLELRRKFELVVQEGQAGALQVAYKTREDSIGAPCVFRVSDAVHRANIMASEPWALGNHQINFAADGLWLPTCWEFHLLDSQPKQNRDEGLGHNPECFHSRDSLLRVLVGMKDREVTSFQIYKTSTKYWDYPGFGYEQLYSGFDQYTHQQHRQFLRWAGPLADCPQCIMAFVAFVLPSECSPSIYQLRGRTIPGRIIVLSGNQKSLPTKFKLRYTPPSGSQEHVQGIWERRYALELETGMEQEVSKGEDTDSVDGGSDQGTEYHETGD